MGRKNVTILGDSRVLDTYYLNDQYAECYGYDKTFPFLLREMVLRKPEHFADIVHIPDHFRGGTIDNNILRVALTNPVGVFLCDGIWETLLNKSHFAEYASEKIKSFSFRNDETLALELSHEKLAALFLNDELPIKPSKYARRMYKIASYFLRRRRACYWMNLIQPDPAHKDRIHYAGNYKCSPVWNACLDAINKQTEQALSPIGGRVFDLHRLMEKHGGEDNALLDQWHFTAKFHGAVANEIFDLLKSPDDYDHLGPDHVSHRHMHGFATEGRDDAIALLNLGPKQASECVVGEGRNIVISTESIDAACAADADIVVLVGDEETKDRAAEKLLRMLPARKIILFSEELDGVNNPFARGAS